MEEQEKEMALEEELETLELQDNLKGKRRNKMNKINKSMLLVLTIGLLLISGTSALNQYGTAKQNEPIRLIQVCSDATYINITSINYRNESLLEPTNMTKISSGTFELYFNDTLRVGRHDVVGISDGCEGEFATYFEITPNGNTFGQAEGLAAIGILIGVLSLTFFFAFLSFKIGENKNLAIFGFMFMVLSIIMSIYSLYLGWVYSYEIILFDSLSEITLTIFRTFMWILIGIVILSMALMLIAFIKELATVNKQKTFGEGFDPITDTYNL